MLDDITLPSRKRGRPKGSLNKKTIAKATARGTAGSLNLPKIETLADLDKAFDRIWEAVSDHSITPAEFDALSKGLERHARRLGVQGGTVAETDANAPDPLDTLMAMVDTVASRQGKRRE